MATVISHVDDLSGPLDDAIKRALDAAGMQAVGCIRDQMENGYKEPHATYSNVTQSSGSRHPVQGAFHTAIHDTGNLQGSINFMTDVGSKTCYVGTGINYATYVHEGTYKLHGRPFIRDGVQKNQARLIQIIKSYLSSGFN